MQIYNHKDPTEMDSYNYQFATANKNGRNWLLWTIGLLTIVGVAAAIAEYNGINLLN